MYTDHWGLHASPFKGSLLDPQFYFGSATHEEALARLQFLADQQRRLGLLLGERGSGKSLLFEVFARQLRMRGGHIAIVRLLGLTNQEFICRLAYELGEDPDPEAPVSRLWRYVTDRLLTNRYQQRETVLLLDDADEAEAGVLTSIARLSQWDPTPDSRLTIVLSSDENRMHRLGERLVELSELRIDVQPWEFQDTVGYLNSTLAKAGRSEETFTTDALEKIQELTHGSPRRVQQLAELVLLAGAGRELTSIDGETVLAVNEELNVMAAIS